jgi:hypothetical protein
MAAPYAETLFCDYAVGEILVRCVHATVDDGDDNVTAGIVGLMAIGNTDEAAALVKVGLDRVVEVDTDHRRVMHHPQGAAGVNAPGNDVDMIVDSGLAKLARCELREKSASGGTQGQRIVKVPTKWPLCLKGDQRGDLAPCDKALDQVLANLA